MAFRLRLVPSKTSIPFMKLRLVLFPISLLLVVATGWLLASKGLNYGIDFAGGISMEIRTVEKADVSAVRKTVNGLGLGDAAIQEFGDPHNVLIRLKRQPGGDEAQQAAVAKTQQALSRDFPGVGYRSVSFVGPRVSEELKGAAYMSVGLAILVVLVYVWARFEWQFGAGLVISLVHVVALTFALYSLTGMEFSLTAVASILTVMGYALNDTVVVFDRIRETLPKYRKMPLPDLLDLAINDTLSRTTTLSMITFLSLVGMLSFAPAVIEDFIVSMIYGIVISTYSSIFIAAPCLIFFNLKRDGGETPDKKEIVELQPQA